MSWLWGYALVRALVLQQSETRAAEQTLLTKIWNRSLLQFVFRSHGPQEADVGGPTGDQATPRACGRLLSPDGNPLKQLSSFARKDKNDWITLIATATKTVDCDETGLISVVWCFISEAKLWKIWKKDLFGALSAFNCWIILSASVWFNTICIFIVILFVYIHLWKPSETDSHGFCCR